MNKLFFCFLLFLTGFGLSAQDITISFQSMNGSTPIDSTWVTNQKTNQKVKLLGGESFVQTTTTGIDLFRNNADEGFLYPNPYNGEASLGFSNSRNQEVEIRVFNISGQVSGIKRQELLSGQHNFKLKFPAIGLYSVTVLKDDGPISFMAGCAGVKMKE